MPGARRFVLGVDLDGVCADFYGALRPIAAEWLGVPLESLTEEVSYGLPEWHLNATGGYEELHRFAVTQRELFRRAQPIKDAGPVLRRLSTRGVYIRVITHRLFIKHFHKEAISQTIEWLDYHAIPYWDLCLMSDKAAVGADLYIEDSPQNVNALRAGGHTTIVFTNSTNRELSGLRADTWKDVNKLVLRELGKWRKRKKRSALPGR